MTRREPLPTVNGTPAQFACAVRNLEGAIDGVAAVVGETRQPGPPGTSEAALPRGWLPARDEQLEQIHVFARTLANFVEAIGRKIENDWTRENGPRLLETRARLSSLRDACDALRPLVRVRFSKAHRNTHLPSRAVMSSLAALDAVAVSDVETDLASTLWYLDRIFPKLERAIESVAGIRGDDPPRDATGIRLTTANIG